MNQNNLKKICLCFKQEEKRLGFDVELVSIPRLYETVTIEGQPFKVIQVEHDLYYPNETQILLEIIK